MSSGGFTDLRLNGDNSSAESFWPAFTDVMTVVVMIFLIVLTVVVLKNYQLVTELQQSLVAEARSAALARSVEEQKLSVEEQLKRAQQRLVILARELTATAELEKQTTVQLNERDEQLAETTETLSSVRLELAEAIALLEALRQKESELQTAYALRGGELESAQAALTAAQTAADEKYAAMEQDFTALKLRYEKLVRPARSTTNKQIAEVRYVKTSGGYQISYKGPQDAGYSPVSREEIDQRLSALKEKDPSKLYIKVVIPEDSGLSYNEAWTFTLDMLNKYDYYYR